MSKSEKKNGDPRTIPIFEAVEILEAKPAGPAARPVQARGAQDRVVRVVETGVDVLTDNMKNFIEGVASMLAAGARVAGAFSIDTVEVECQISGGGKIGFAGTGVDLQGGSSMKIVFKQQI